MWAQSLKEEPQKLPCDIHLLIGHKPFFNHMATLSGKGSWEIQPKRLYFHIEHTEYYTE